VLRLLGFVPEVAGSGRRLGLGGAAARVSCRRRGVRSGVSIRRRRGRGSAQGRRGESPPLRRMQGAPRAWRFGVEWLRSTGTRLGFASTMDPDGLEARRGSIVRWSRLWGLPRLGHEISLRTSSRLQRSLGSYCARRAEITVAAWLLEGPTDLLEEVLCHEAAHAAVHLAHGTGVRPHGPEWRAFMALAEMPARVRMPASDLIGFRKPASTKARVWEHRCPVCQATRFAKTRVTRWRCRLCREAGHSGELLVERVPSPVAVDG